MCTCSVCIIGVNKHVLPRKFYVGYFSALSLLPAQLPEAFSFFLFFFFGIYLTALFPLTLVWMFSLLWSICVCIYLFQRWIRSPENVRAHKKHYFDLAACRSLCLLYPSQPGVAGGGGLQGVRGSRPARFSWFLSNNGFNSG